MDKPQLEYGTPLGDAEQAVDLIRGLVLPEALPAFERFSRGVLRHVRDLAGRLQRQEHANLIMREHLTMLSKPDD